MHASMCGLGEAAAKKEGIYHVGIARRDGVSAACVRVVIGPGNRTVKGRRTHVAHSTTARRLLFWSAGGGGDNSDDGDDDG